MNNKPGSLREQKRQNMLQVGADLLKTNSYYDITLDLIAEKVGTTKSNFYHYFDSKEQLYQEVFSFPRPSRWLPNWKAN